MVQKKWIIIAGVIATIVVISGASIYFFLGGFLGGLFESPVDISRINLSSNLTTRELLPMQLDNKPLNEETVEIGTRSGFRNFATYRLYQTRAYYDDIKIAIMKAETETEATTAFDAIYSGDPFDHISGFQHKKKTSWWFTYDADGVSDFFWKSGIWIFGVEAGDGETRNQVASELAQELRSR